MSKNIFLVAASCMNGILQALCHVRISQCLRGFRRVWRLSTVAGTTRWYRTVAQRTV